MILHTVAGSPNGRKVEAVIHHLGLTVDIRDHDLFNGELGGPAYLAINPNAKVPVLVDGDFKLWESTAIMQYLAQTAGDTDLFPRDARMRADITRWQCWEMAHFNQAFGALAFETVAKAKFNVGPADATIVNKACANLARFTPVLDHHLQGRQYLVGDSLTIADYSMVPFESYVDLVPFDFSPYHQIHSYFERMRKGAAWQRSARPATSQSIAA